MSHFNPAHAKKAINKATLASILTEGTPGITWPLIRYTIEATESLTIPEDYQLIVCNHLYVDGILDNFGEVCIL